MSELSKKSTPKRTKRVIQYHKRWPGAFEGYAQIFVQMRKNPEPALFFSGTYLAVSLLTRLFHGGSVQGSFSYQIYEDLFQLIILLAIPTYALSLANRTHISIGEAMRFDGKKYVFLVAAIIIFVVCFLCSILLFIVPVIWIVGWFSLYQFPIVEHAMNPIEALKESKRLARDHKTDVWGILGVSLLLTIVELPFIYVPVVSLILPAYTMFVIVISTAVLAELYRLLQQNDRA